MAEGAIEKVKVVGNRGKMVFKVKEVAEEIQKSLVEQQAEVKGGDLLKVKRKGS